MSLVYLMSAVDVASMYACAITVRHESTVADLLMSKTKSGFLMTFTQNRSGTLEGGVEGGQDYTVEPELDRDPPPPPPKKKKILCTCNQAP